MCIVFKLSAQMALHLRNNENERLTKRKLRDFGLKINKLQNAPKKQLSRSQFYDSFIDLRQITFPVCFIY